MQRDTPSTYGAVAYVPISDRLRTMEESFTAKERRIAKVLLTGYPTAGLETVAELGRLAQTSGATILRFVSKLGFPGYPDFQEGLRSEIVDTLQSPLARYRSVPASGEGRGFARYADWASGVMHQAADMISEREFAEVVALIEDERNTLHLVGGRFSRSIAELFCYGLSQLRSRVHLLDGTPQSMMKTLLDVGRRDVVVVFDFRRYQGNIVRFAEQAAQAGATLVVFTDKWQSPSAGFAKYVFALPVASPSIFDSALAPVLCVEAIVCRFAERIGAKARLRIAKADAIYGDLREGGVSASE